MALSETNLNKICKILGVEIWDLEAQITWMGARITAQVQTDIAAEITRWDAGAGTNFTKIEPREKNFGASISPESAKADIRSNIAVLLGRKEWAENSSGHEVILTRG